MNFNYKELSRKIYLEIKPEEDKWKDKDLAILDKIASHIKDEVGRIKRAEKYQEKIKADQTKIREERVVLENPLDILNMELPFQPKKGMVSRFTNIETQSIDSLEQRIFEERDKAETELIINQVKQEQLSKEVIKPEVKINTSGLERYQVRVRINANLKVKPNFQVFKVNSEEIYGNNGIMENTFHNFLFYIDSDSEEKIRKHMVEIFEPGQMSFDISIVPFDYVPVQYTATWRNQTHI